MNYYPFHIGDYASATRHLSWDEDLAYRRLLDVYYTSEKPLPSDLRQVCRLVLATTESQRAAVEVVLAEFFELTAEGWASSRADAEIVAMLDKQQKQRDRANKRWGKQAEATGNAKPDATAMPRHEESNATASNNDATAMPPTPTPTPTPTPIKGKSASAKRDKPASVTQPEDVSESVWQDFLAVRQAKRAPLTNTALDNIRREAGKAGMTLQAALAMCCARGWSGFNASWEGVKNFTNPVQQTGETQYQRAARERAAEWSPSIAKGAPEPERQLGQVIDGDVVEVKTNLLGVA
mgnify:CR=1 FL=1